MLSFRTGLALFVLLLILLIVSAPARLLGFVVSSDVLVMQGFSGSIWRGSAARCVVRVGHGYLNLGSVKWHLKPMTLLTFSPTIDLESQWGRQAISGIVTLKSIENNDIDIADLDATISAGLLRQFAPLQVEGEISALAQSLSIRSGMLDEGEGQIVWRDAAWTSPTGSIELGSYAMNFEQPAGQSLTGEILTISGPVKARGDIELNERNYTLNAFIEADPGLNQQVQQAISLFAQPVAGGYRIALDGKL